MFLYFGIDLSIRFDKLSNRFVQNWKSSPITISEFQHEMLEYTKLYLEHKPSQSMWLQQNFKLDLDQETQEWIEEKVNIPCKIAGNKQLAFVISEDFLAHMKVIGAFEKVNSCIIPHHFATQEGAEKWLNDLELPSKSYYDNLTIIYNGTDENGFSELTIKTKSGEVLEVIRLFDNLLEESNFVKQNLKKYLLLTEREREILLNRSLGLQLGEIASKLCISLYTSQTHWRNVKRKLEINNAIDAAKYIKAFCN